MPLRNFFTELKRRNVYKVAVAYAIVGWLLIQVATQVFPFFDIPNWAVRLIVLAIIVGFPLALIIAWAFDLTPEGLKRTEPGDAAPATRSSPRAWIYLVGVAAVLLVGTFFLGRYLPKNGPADLPEKSIAVLPLENLSEKKEDAFFADSIQDDILTSLAKVSDLKVISRTSVMQYRGAARNLREIGTALGVANIVEGSVRRVGDRVLVNVQLIDAQNDRHLWAERYDRTLADSIGLQGELATEIANALHAKLAPEEKASLATKPTSSPEAYLLYLQAKQEAAAIYSKAQALRADALYAKAIALDPKFALAYARASILNGQFYWILREPERKTKARALVEEALRLAPDLGEAHLALGLYFYSIDNDYERALQEMAIAGAAAPNDPEIMEARGRALRRLGRFKEALALFQRAQEVDPRTAHLDLPDTYRELRQWEKAVLAYERVAQLDPQAAAGWVGLAYVQFARNGDLPTARATIERAPEALKSVPGMAGIRWSLAMFARDWTGAETVLPDRGPEEFPAIEPKAYYQAEIALARGQVAVGRKLLEELRPMHEAAVRDHPGDPNFLRAISGIDVLLGRKEDALREARRALALCPESKDAVAGVSYAVNLAYVYAQCGEQTKPLPCFADYSPSPSPT